MQDLLIDIYSVIWITPFSGATGGALWFLYGLNRGRYRNNKYKMKFSIESFGGMAMGFFGSLPFTSLPPEARISLSFAIGLAWSEVIQTFRVKFTAMVQGALQGAFQGALNSPESEEPGGD